MSLDFCFGNLRNSLVLAYLGRLLPQVQLEPERVVAR